MNTSAPPVSSYHHCCRSRMFLCFMPHSMPTSPSSRARCLQLLGGLEGGGGQQQQEEGRNPDITLSQAHCGLHE
jgi:hypothetical protein